MPTRARLWLIAVRAEASAAASLAGEWRTAIAAEVERRQRQDGSFRNDGNHLMKEDDPILATALALNALSHAR
jgi:hypothetical protein